MYQMYHFNFKNTTKDQRLFIKINYKINQNKESHLCLFLLPSHDPAGQCWTPKLMHNELKSMDEQLCMCETQVADRRTASDSVISHEEHWSNLT